MLLTRDKVVTEMHLKEPGFTHSSCGPMNKTKKRIQKLKETGDSRQIYRNELDKGLLIMEVSKT